MNEEVWICRSSKGCWGEPIPAIKLKWISESGKQIKPPKTLSCEHPNHKGRKRRLPIEEIYRQSWELSNAEFEEAIEKYDLMSMLEIKRFICEQCLKINNDK